MVFDAAFGEVIGEEAGCGIAFGEAEPALVGELGAGSAEGDGFVVGARAPSFLGR